MKTFPIDFIRELIYQTLKEEKFKNNGYKIANGNYINGERLIGGDEVALTAFYEELVQEEQVSRYVDNFRELTEQQNRKDLIANGVITAPENPSITNINQTTIRELSFLANFRLKKEDRDLVLQTLDNLIVKLKGRKWDMALFSGGSILKVNTLANNSVGAPTIPLGAYLGNYVESEETSIDDFVGGVINDLVTNYGFSQEILSGYGIPYYYYVSVGFPSQKMRVVYLNNETQKYEFLLDNSKLDIVIPPLNETFTKYKVSIAFDSERCDTPKFLNSDKVIHISFNGNATLCSSSIMLGNDLTKVVIKKDSIEGIETSPYSDYDIYYLEPLELPSENNISTLPSQLISKQFLSTSHATNMNLSLNYSFVMDFNIELLEQLFMYARYGINGVSANQVSPNTIYEITEIYSSWGELRIITFKAKIVENIQIQNNDSDIVSISLPFQLQSMGETDNGNDL